VAHPERMVIHFARNSMCALARPNSAVPALQSQMPYLTSIKLPATLTVEPADGLVILNSKPVALRFIAFVMSEEGQAILGSHGFEPVASAPPARP
jgi:molybdate transport system substrate-binding protein